MSLARTSAVPLPILRLIVWLGCQAMAWQLVGFFLVRRGVVFVHAFTLQPIVVLGVLDGYAQQTVVSI